MTTDTQRPETFDGHNGGGRTYYFAKPTYTQHGLAAYTRPLLLAQMQHFDSLGHLKSTVDVLSVSFLTSRLIKDVRHFIRQRKRTPDFVLMSDEFHPDESVCSNDNQTSKMFVGAAFGNSQSIGARDGCVRTFWVGELSFTMFSCSDRTYEIFVDKKLVSQWKAKKLNEACILPFHCLRTGTKSNGTQNIRGFDLTELKTMTVVAQLRRDHLTLLESHSPHNQSVATTLNSHFSNEEENVVLLTAAWVAYSEGWFPLEL